ncbi:TetR/AcrR family transcriptional regulator [Achromobacter spanius]|uniref:TetR/AcrR family transcriptional regulator n=1 Tax=Achromobacter spanius TaxID=217203 RepID=UPI003825C50B
MARIDAVQATANRALIVKEASSLLRSHGLQRITIAHVMRAAGLIPGSFYIYFESEESLAAEACERAFRDVAQCWRKVGMAAQAEGSDVCKALVEHYLEPKLAEQTCPMLALAETARRPGLNGSLHVAYRAGVQLLMETFLELVAPGSETAERSRLVRKFFSMVGENLLISTASERSEVPALSYRDRG